jgi:hypothetical protein
MAGYGTYKNLLQTNPNFSSMVKEFSSVNHEEEEEDVAIPLE